MAEYAVYHFDAEEKIWHEYMPDDPFESDHQKVHSSFLTEVLRLKSEENTKPVSKVIEEILAFLTRWLAAHILESDRSMAMVVTAMKSGMSLEEAKKHAAEQMRGATRVLIDIILSIYESLSTNTLHLMRELAEQKRMTMLLDDQERHFEILFSTTPVGIFETDINGKCLYVNARWSEITGLSIEDAKGDGWTKALHPEDKDRIYAEWSASTLENRPFNLEYRFLHANGKTVWVLGQSATYKSRLNDQSGYIGTITDITERKNSELALFESRNLLSAIVDNVPIRVFWKDKNLHYLGCNTAFAKDAGFMHPNELIGKDDYQMGWSAQADLYRADDLAVIKSGNAKLSFDEPQTTPDGKLIWLRTSKIPLKNGNEEASGILGVYEDITEQREAEQRLIASEKLARATIDLSPIPLALNDRGGNITYLNAAFIQAIGYTLNDIPTLTEWWPLAYPDLAYRQKVIENWQKNWNDVVSNNKPFAPIEIDIKCKDNSVRTFICNAVNLTNDFAETHVISFFDITERKQAENELKIAATIFESQEGMMVTDSNAVILRVNHAFTKITGYTADDAIGQTPRILSSGRQGKGFYTAMWESIHNTGAWEGEIWNRRKNGEVYPEYLIITAIKNEAGIVANYVATFTDITMSKAASEAIRTLAFYDQLTQLPNRRLLVDRLTQAMAVSKRNEVYGALMFLDLDNFKPLNDIHGHVVGDLLLIEAANRLTSCMREMDTVARFGGDEFVVLLGELDQDKTISITQATVVAEKVRAVLAEPYLLPITDDAQLDTIVEHRCTASIGIAMFISHETSQNDLMKHADAAMYKAKDAGRNQIRFYGDKD